MHSISEVTRHRALLVLGWVTAVSLWNQPPRSTQPDHPSVGRRSEYRRKRGQLLAGVTSHWACVTDAMTGLTV